MDTSAGLAYTINQGYKFYVYISEEADEESAVEAVKDLLESTNIVKSFFEIVRCRFIKKNQLVCTVLPLYKMMECN